MSDEEKQELQAALTDHALAVENMRKVILRVFPDPTEPTFPSYPVRNHMAAVLRSLEQLSFAWDRTCARPAAEGGKAGR